MTDQDLLSDYARAGSEQAFTEIVRRYSGLVHGVCLRILGENHAADDAAQAVFLVLVRKGGKLPPGTLLSGWLYRTAVFVASRALTSRERRLRREEEAARMRDQGVERRPEIEPRLDAALAALPERYRDAIVLRYLRNLSRQEVAQELGCPEPTVQTRLKRGLARLRRGLAASGLAVTADALPEVLAASAAHVTPEALAATITATCREGSSAAHQAANTLAEEAMKTMFWMKVKTTLVAGVAAVVLATGGGLAAKRLLAGESPAKGDGRVGGKPQASLDLPVNKWVEKALSGLQCARVTHNKGLSNGVLYHPGRGAFLACGDKAEGRTAGKIPELWELDLAAGTWKKRATKAVSGYDRLRSPKNKRYLVREHYHGLNVCFDPVRKRIFGVTDTSLGNTGRTTELNPATGQWNAFKPDPSPPPVTAGSLCYDPVNNEAVLATGGFSPRGGTDGCWLFDGARKRWRKLEGPREVDAIRLPLRKLALRAKTLRWLSWKNMEYRGTGREGMLEPRSRGVALAKEADALGKALATLGGQAAKNSAAAKRDYHKQRLLATAGLLRKAAAEISRAAATLKSGGPEAIESLYRKSLVPAQGNVEKALSEVAIHPEPRMSSRVVYDSKHKVMVCFGGDRTDGLWGDTWVYHCEGRWWERRHPKAHPVPDKSMAMAFDTGNGLVVRLSPYRRLSHGKGHPAGLWTYDAGLNEWKLLDMKPPKDAFWLFYDSGNKCLVAFSEVLTKAWLLNLDVATAVSGKASAAPEVELRSVEGPMVLRDAVGLAELKAWKARTVAWRKSVPDNTWIVPPNHGTGRTLHGNHWCAMVYDPDRRCIYFRGGGHGGYHGSDTSHYDIPTGRWFRGARACVPGWPMGAYFCWGRSFSKEPWGIHTYKFALYYDPLNKRLQRTLFNVGTFGGADSSTHVLQYDPDTGMWDAGFSETPPRKWNGLKFIVPGVTTGVAWVGAWSIYGKQQLSSRVWYKTAEGFKTWKDAGSAGGTLNSRMHAACVFFDPKRERLLACLENKGWQLYALDLKSTASKWQRLNARAADGGPIPIPTREVVYIPRHDRFLIVEDHGKAVLTSKTKVPNSKGKEGSDHIIWSIDPTTNVFTRVGLAGEAAKRVEHHASIALQYDPGSNMCFFRTGSRGTRFFAFRYVPAK